MVAPIVVGIDASAPSRAALCWAADHCAGFGASLVLLHAVGRCSPDTDPGSTERARAFVDGEADYARSGFRVWS
jgi:nucleotide-binding universal stress UspA family protein